MLIARESRPRAYDGLSSLAFTEGREGGETDMRKLLTFSHDERVQNEGQETKGLGANGQPDVWGAQQRAGTGRVIRPLVPVTGMVIRTDDPHFGG
jgi:hypothetical protein